MALGRGPQGWLGVTAARKVFIFAVCHAIRQGRPRRLPLSISGDTWRLSKARDGLMETLPGRRGSFYFPGGKTSGRSAVTLLEYWMSGGRGQGLGRGGVMFTQQILHFCHVTSGGRYMERGQARSPPSPPFFFCWRLTLSANLSSADYFFPSLRFPRTHAAELTFVFAFKWSNFSRVGRCWGGGRGGVMWEGGGGD